jgi:hypothetical protein
MAMRHLISARSSSHTGSGPAITGDPGVDRALLNLARILADIALDLRAQADMYTFFPQERQGQREAERRTRDPGARGQE